MQEYTVKELIEELQKFNLEAKVCLNINSFQHPFSLAWGGPESVTKETAETVSFYSEKSRNKETENL